MDISSVISFSEINLITHLLNDYKSEFDKIKQFVKYTGYMGYHLSDSCPKCLSKHDEHIAKMFYCSYDDIIPDYVRSRHYVHLCDICEKTIMDIYSTIYDLCVGKNFNIRRSNGNIELWNCYAFFPIVLSYDEETNYKIPNIMFVMTDKDNNEKIIPMDTIIELNF